MMDEENFEMVTQQLLMMANLVKDLKLAEYIEAINKSDAVGPILDPTLWRKGHQKTTILRKMAEGLVKFQRSIPTLEEALRADIAAE